MSTFLLALALLFTFGAGMCAGWKLSVYALCRAVRTGQMRELIDMYEAKYGRPE